MLPLGLAMALAGTTLRVPDDYPNLNAALKDAVEGDTVYLSAGTWPYSGNRALHVPIVGQGSATVLERNGSNVLVDMASSSTVELSNLTLDGQGQPILTCEGNGVERNLPMDV